eukprot:TRINITY_DN5066_c1_g1_i1.p3 TRINITY_DN5066_c1_g1~~TRINITY_DN5066_c1_g1_i1.p3  ORF type:complete len:119 (-),score=15.00 TRINITY_DN5066_c1_g1_i1:95-451(-)
MLFLRGNAPNTTLAQAISFGTAPVHPSALAAIPAAIRSLITGNHNAPGVACNRAGLPAFQINVPVSESFHCDPAADGPVGLPENLVINLFDGVLFIERFKFGLVSCGETSKGRSHRQV